MAVDHAYASTHSDTSPPFAFSSDEKQLERSGVCYDRPGTSEAVNFALLMRRILLETEPAGS